MNNNTCMSDTNDHRTSETDSKITSIPSCKASSDIVSGGPIFIDSTSSMNDKKTLAYIVLKRLARKGLGIMIGDP